MRLHVQLAAALSAWLIFASAGGSAAALADAHVAGIASDSIATQRDAAYERYRERMADGQNAAAVAAATEVLELTRQLHGEDSAELASPLTNLATARLRSGEFTDAEAGYQAAIALLEKHEGFLSLRLVNPLVGLGETYIRSEQYELATAAYEKALHINHVNEGFYNPDQASIRDGLTEGYLGLLDLEQANLHQDAQVYAKQRRLGADNPELIAAYTKLGRWYDRSGQAERARFAYQNAARIAELAGDAESGPLPELMLDIAGTYRLQALLPASTDSGPAAASLLAMSSTTLKRALAMVDGHQPVDPVRRARILVELGDLYLLWGKRNTASNYYRDAWQALSADPGLQATREEFFAAPRRIAGPVPPRVFPVPARNAPPPSRQDLEPGFVVVRFDVDQSGRVLDPAVIEADPANLLEDDVTGAAARTLYRPRYVDAAPVTTTGFVLRHEFRYAPKKLEKKDAPPAANDGKPLEQPTSGDGA